MTQIELLMKKLGCTKEEALDIIKTDKEINKGADPFPLTAEQKKVEKPLAPVALARPPLFTSFRTVNRKRQIPRKKQSLQKLQNFSRRTVKTPMRI